VDSPRACIATKGCAAGQSTAAPTASRPRGDDLTVADLELHCVPDGITPPGVVHRSRVRLVSRESAQLYDRLTRCDEAAQERFAGRRLGREMLDE